MQINRRMTVALLATLLSSAAAGQPIQQVPTFEVATIKPNTISNGARGGCRGSDSRISPNDVMRATVPLGRCVITAARLSHLLNIAFEIPLDRISGLPDWDGPSRFDIEGKADDPASTTEHGCKAGFEPGIVLDPFLGSGTALALVLAAVGIYSVVACAVSLRTREYALRKALGASNDRIVHFCC